MAFWSAATEPLRKNRWVVIFGGGLNPNLSDFAYALKKVDKPSYKTLDITHKFGNYSFYYPGRVEWNTINMTFASVVEQSTAGAIKSVDRQLLQILKNGNPVSAEFSGVSNDQANALKGISKKAIGSALGQIIITQLGADGDAADPIESWTLINPFFTNIKFGDLSYDSEEVVDVEVTVRYDSATYAAGTNSEI